MSILRQIINMLVSEGIFVFQLRTIKELIIYKIKDRNDERFLTIKTEVSV